MLKFRWIAPIQVDIYSVPGARDRNPDADREFWLRAKKLLGRPNWTFTRALQKTNALAYTEAVGDTLPQPLEILTAKLNEIPNEFDELIATNITWTLFDHGIIIAEGEFHAENDLKMPPNSASAYFEEKIQQCAYLICNEHIRNEIDSLTRALQTISDLDSHLTIRSRSSTESQEQSWTNPNWISRAVLYDSTDRIDKEFSHSWVQGINTTTDIDLDNFFKGHTSNVTEWMNYIYITSDQDRYSTLWTALRRAQYFYAAMMAVDSKLRLILSKSMQHEPNLPLAQLRFELQATMDQAQELILIQAEVGKYGSRLGNSEMKRILDCWNYEEVLDRPVKEKLALCQSRLETIASDRASRNNLVTDIILMTIGVTSILATVIALVQFGRESSADAQQSALDIGRGSITYWISSQSIDSIVVISSIVSVGLIITYWWKRRQSDS